MYINDKHFWSYEHMAVTFKNYHISPIIVQQYYRNKNTDELVHKTHGSTGKSVFHLKTKNEPVNNKNAAVFILCSPPPVWVEHRTSFVKENILYTFTACL